MARSESMRSGARRGAKLDPAVLSELMGHDGDGRTAIQPLPSTGHPHADGRIRRVMLTAPECVDVLSRLTVHPRESQSRAFWRASHPHLRANTGPIGRIPGRESGETEFTYGLIRHPALLGIDYGNTASALNLSGSTVFRT